jgi:hypothetical protein
MFGVSNGCLNGGISFLNSFYDNLYGKKAHKILILRAFYTGQASKMQTLYNPAPKSII